MRVCSQREEVVSAVRAGQWPLGCGLELREHVASCAQCADEVQLIAAFTVARESAMRSATPQSAGLLWWKAQLRRRHEAMERLERPGLAIPAATLAGSIVVLLALLVFAAKHADWPQILTMFAVSGWNPWMIASIATVLCGFGIAAVVVGLGSREERS